MKNSTYNSAGCRALLALAAAVALTLCAAAFSPAADEALQGPTRGVPETSDEMLTVTSDRLVSDSASKYAEFIGNVKVTQGATVIRAERIKIYFEKQPGKQGDPAASRESIEKIIANGSVIINFDNKVAVSEQAVYTTGTQILVLTGENSKITSGTDSIAGEKITLYRADGRIKVEGRGEKKVEAVFYPKDKGVN